MQSAISLILLTLVASACGPAPAGQHQLPVEPAATAPEAAAAPSRYSLGPASRDGIGKRYLGREISQVMGHRGARWLDREDRQVRERTDLLIELLPLQADSQVADIGAGTGYFTVPVARRVPQGQVYAVDIQPEMLDLIKARQQQAGLQNIVPVLGSATSPGLPAAAMDVIFIVDAYHEFSHPFEMGQGLYNALKPGGQLVLIEYRQEDPQVPIKPLHKMSQAQAIKEMAAVGLKWQRTIDALPQQHFMVFARPSTTVADKL